MNARALKGAGQYSMMVLVAVDGVIMTAAMVLFIAGMIGVAAVLADGLDGVILWQGMGVPDFGYEGAGRGNSLFDVYAQLRWGALVLLGCYAALYPLWGVEAWAARMRKVALLCVLLFAFPPVWDAAAYAAGAAGMWVLNPVYTFDEDRPCPHSWSAADITSYGKSSPYSIGGPPSDACTPGHRIAYVVEQAAGLTRPEPGGRGVLEFIDAAIRGGVEGWFVNVFGVLAKAVTLINLVLILAVAGIMLDMFTGLVIGSLPVWVVLCLVPRFGPISERFLSAIPGILMVPICTGVVLVAGSSAVAAAGDGGELGSWLSAVAVLFLSAMLPVLLVPAAGQMVHHSSDVIQRGVAAGAAILFRGVGGLAAGGDSRGASPGPKAHPKASHNGTLEGLAKRTRDTPNDAGAPWHARPQRP